MEGIMQALRLLKAAFQHINQLLVRVCPAGMFEYTFFARIHLLFFMLVVMGPVVALMSWQGQKRVDDLLARGTPAVATVTKTTITRVKSTTYSLDLVWRDLQGAERRLEGFTVSPGFYGQVTRAKQPATVRIQYVQDQTTSTRRTVATDDHVRNSDGGGLMRVFLVMGLIGIPGTVLMTLWRNRRLCRARLARILTA
jgi:hypothetical protein